VVYLNRVPFVSVAEEIVSKVRDLRLREAQLTERVPSEEGTWYRRHIVQLAENLDLRSRKRRNSGESEGSIQGPSSWYVSCVTQLVYFSVPTLEFSQDPERTRKENGGGGGNGGQHADGCVFFRAQPELY